MVEIPALKARDGKIIEVLSDEVAVLSGGAKDGLRSGMLLVRESDRTSGPITVLFTEPDRCVIAMHRPGREAFPVSSGSAASPGISEPKPFDVGETISTRTPDAWNDR